MWIFHRASKISRLTTFKSISVFVVGDRNRWLDARKEKMVTRLLRDVTECARPQALQCESRKRAGIFQRLMPRGCCCGRGRPHSAKAFTAPRLRPTPAVC